MAHNRLPALPPLAITQGDVAGIGPETIAKLFRDQPELTRGCFVVGSLAALRRAAHWVAQAGEPALPLAAIAHPRDAMQLPPRCIPVLSPPGMDGPLPVPGQIDAQAGRWAGLAVQWAARAALAGEVAALVTAPLHKEALHAAGAPFDCYPGHTELLQAEAAAFLGQAPAAVPVRMMLANEELRTVLVSIHLSLRQALDAVTYDQVLQTLHITHQALLRMLGRVPRIAVAGLNPHAGEGGLLGCEEQTVIGPAIAAARAAGLDANGPFAPDTVFMRARAPAPGQVGAFDVVVAMYHDQGLIPVKYLGVEQGVNVTLGLPLVRTSPDHGTAFDVAGSGRADPASLAAALRMARQLSL